MVLGDQHHLSEGGLLPSGKRAWYSSEKKHKCVSRHRVFECFLLLPRELALLF